MVDLRPNSEIADGIHWIKGYSNNYIIESGDDLILIDTNMNRKAKGIMRYIRSELSDKRVSKVFLTHHHVDHVNGAHVVEKVFHPIIYINERDADYVIHPKRRPLPRNWLIKPLFFVVDPFIRNRAVHGVEYVVDGQQVDGISALFLPGHTEGSMGFLRNGVMFSGDAVVTDRRGNASLPPGVFTENMEQAKASFKKLAGFDFEVLVGGHGPPILEGASERVKEAVERLGL